jgi:hypothetical protein
MGLEGDIHSRSARIRAFRAFQHTPPNEREKIYRQMKQRSQTWKAVHLLSAEEVKSLFRDVAEGLGFLVSLLFYVLAVVLMSLFSIIDLSCTWI